jgi:hypothetical protein
MSIPTCKACAVDILHSMIWDQKFLLPPHEYDSSVPVINRHMWKLSFVLYMFECGESRPMHDIFMPGCTPVLGEETISTTNDLSIKISGQLWPIVCQTADPEITAQRRCSKVHVLTRTNLDKRPLCQMWQQRTTIVTWTS